MTITKPFESLLKKTVVMHLLKRSFVLFYMKNLILNTLISDSFWLNLSTLQEIQAMGTPQSSP